jgi:hypothetical protein
VEAARDVLPAADPAGRIYLDELRDLTRGLGLDEKSTARA